MGIGRAFTSFRVALSLLLLQQHLCVDILPKTCVLVGQEVKEFVGGPVVLAPNAEDICPLRVC